MKTRKHLLAAAIIVVGTSSAYAQSQSTQSNMQMPSACNADAQKYCGTSRGGDQHSCMTSNMTNLSSACKNAMKSSSGSSTGNAGSNAGGAMHNGSGNNSGNGSASGSGSSNGSGYGSSGSTGTTQ